MTTTKFMPPALEDTCIYQQVLKNIEWIVDGMQLLTEAELKSLKRKIVKESSYHEKKLLSMERKRNEAKAR